MTRSRSPSLAAKSSAMRTSAPFAPSPTRSMAACPSRTRESMTRSPDSMPSMFSATSFSRSPMSLTSSFWHVALIVVSCGLAVFDTSPLTLFREASRAGGRFVTRARAPRRKRERDKMFEPCEVAGLGHVRENSDLQHLDGFLGLLLSCHDDDRDGLVDHPNLLEKLEPVELFHLGIEHDEIGAAPVHGGNGFAAVLGGKHLVGATVLEQPEEPREGSTLGPFGKNEN